jgi:hypothetical protein
MYHAMGLNPCHFAQCVRGRQASDRTRSRRLLGLVDILRVLGEADAASSAIDWRTSWRSTAVAKRGQGEGSIYKRKTDGRWAASVTLGYVNGKRKRQDLLR